MHNRWVRSVPRLRYGVCICSYHPVALRERLVIRGLFGPNTVVGDLRTSLDDQSARHRTISGRIANLTTPNETRGFAADLSQQLGNREAVDLDLQQKMVELADTSLRYDVSARLLQRAYQQLRSAIRERA